MRTFTVQRFVQGLFALSVVFLFTAVVLFAYRARLHAQCEQDLSRIASAFSRYVTVYDAYPPSSTVPGKLMFERETLSPEYLGDNAPIDDESYYYLGYLVFHERSGLAWIDAYKKCVPNGATIANKREIWSDCVYAFEERKKAFEEEHQRLIARGEVFLKGVPLRVSTLTFHQVATAPTPEEECFYWRLEVGVERHVLNYLPPEITIGNPGIRSEAQLRVPIMFERPELHDDGGHVLCMDGHVEFVPYPGKFPMTPAFIEGLRSLDELKK